MGLSVELANNVAFFSPVLAQLLNVLNMRDADENVFVNQVTRNKWVWAALTVCLAALIGAYTMPGLNQLLSLQNTGSDAWLLVAIGALLPTVIIQGVKQWVKSRRVGPTRCFVQRLQDRPWESSSAKRAVTAVAGNDHWAAGTGLPT
ncbi:MAG: cation-translocating P-type ATPase C-terminal domain-containing protein [Xanthomonadales bacterium]|nr:cation-translocating P-type ATPase C-terminal domain-containing protein [Xanthomonadales bacterium]